MPNVLYNNNSNLIRRFQRSSLSRQHRLKVSQKASLKKNAHNNDPEEDIPFESQFGKNSEAYLRELACSIYPSSLHKSICSLSSYPDLQIHVFVALLVKNFINSWYGTKIPAKDDQFHNEIFSIIQRLLGSVRNNNIDFELLLLDDLPYIIANHLMTLQICKTKTTNKQLIYQQYCRINLLDEARYPYTISNVIQDSLNSHSTLQIAFIDSLLNQLLLGRVADSAMEPYYVIRLLAKISKKINDQKSKVNKNKVQSRFPSNFNSVYKYFRFLFDRRKEYNEKIARQFSERYIFSFLLCDVLHLHLRKPILYFLFKMILSIPVVNFILKDVFGRYLVENTIRNKIFIGGSMNFLRTTLFPNDNSMGPRTIIPTGLEFELIKVDCSDEMWKACLTLKLNYLLGLRKDDIIFLVDLICVDKSCSKLLCFTLIDCILAHLTE
ncbi:hypothetical protein KAFR_0B06090 [Kazachstania africana CBS 2517]|uniref:PXA domain-containing protein n=1 Tax=Kazachstania africana (strain ATCC 22294 / BCRC 22015 / CBS 2517 / CECT 1963 / NBRC 1671 / NRRL Y-8276) TaxID=1071382 RepID=H2ARA5_KAZAF|nr:hypothetical protein KAFR_0B06090 [Kazachstania africana CBS 2517]CCF56905.1 hypothetical protein KAFR_0B06090 [Kazachstania africana CBS 2517]